MTTPSKDTDRKANEPTAAGPTGKVPEVGDLPETTPEDKDPETTERHESARRAAGVRTDEVKRYEDADDGATLIHLTAGYAVLVDKDGTLHPVTNAKGERVSAADAEAETPAQVQARANEPGAAGGTLPESEKAADPEKVAEEAVGIETDDSEDDDDAEPETPAKPTGSTRKAPGTGGR